MLTSARRLCATLALRMVQGIKLAEAGEAAALAAQVCGRMRVSQPFVRAVQKWSCGARCMQHVCGAQLAVSITVLPAFKVCGLSRSSAAPSISQQHGV